MAKLFRVTLSLAVVMALSLAVGCSKKENPTTPEITQNQLPANQQSAVADLGQSMALSAEGNVGFVSGFMDGSKGSKTPPDTCWHGPDAQGWYWMYFSGDTLTYLYKYGLKFTPDIWASGPPYADPTKVEWKMVYQDTTTYNFWYYASCEYQSATDTTHVKGVWEYHYSFSSGGYNLGYNWVTNFDNVSIATGDHSGHYAYTCSYPTYGTTGIIQVTLTGEFTFIADGSGTGNTFAGGTEVVRYVFYADGSSPRGYYQLASENWGTNHNFGK